MTARPADDLMEACVTLPTSSIDRLMPMHLRIDDNGAILGTGPSVGSLADRATLQGRPVLDVLTILEPAGVSDPAMLFAAADVPLSLTFHGDRPIALFGLFVLDATGGGVLALTPGLPSRTGAMGSGGPGDASAWATTGRTPDLLGLLKSRGEALLEARRLIGRLQSDKSRVEALAFTDPLTGLANRRALDLAIRKAARTDIPFAACLIDLDHFKDVNDTLGHPAGDDLLRAVAERLRGAVRHEDLVGRSGGDEFVILFRSATDRADLDRVMDRILADLGQLASRDETACCVSASIGIAVSSEYTHPDGPRMLVDADAALYAAKEGGRGRWSFSDPTGRCSGRAVSRGRPEPDAITGADGAGSAASMPGDVRASPARG